jgi:hypothetical protein
MACPGFRGLQRPTLPPVPLAALEKPLELYLDVDATAVDHRPSLGASVPSLPRPAWPRWPRSPRGRLAAAHVRVNGRAPVAMANERGQGSPLLPTQVEQKGSWTNWRWRVH